MARSLLSHRTGVNPPSTEAARQSHVRMVCSSASKRSSTEPIDEGRGAWSRGLRWFGVGHLACPIRGTSMCPSWSLTGYSQCSRPMTVHGHHRSMGRPPAFSVTNRARHSRQCSGSEKGPILLHLKFGRRLLGCHSRLGSVEYRKRMMRAGILLSRLGQPPPIVRVPADAARLDERGRGRVATRCERLRFGRSGTPGVGAKPGLAWTTQLLIGLCRHSSSAWCSSLPDDQSALCLLHPGVLSQ